MELFERVDALTKYAGMSRSSLGKRLRVKQTTFNGYFSKDRQNGLWPLLKEISAFFPHISREWLFFGEGEMLKKDMDEPQVSQRRERELLLKIEQLSSLVVRLQDQVAAQ